MFKGGRRSGANFPSTLNTPIVIHEIAEPQYVSKDQVLKFLETFIDSKETLVSNVSTSIGVESSSMIQPALDNAMQSVDTNLTSSLSQLKRLQRDFKGLPPAMATSTSSSSESASSSSASTEEVENEENLDDQGNSVMKSATGGTKKKFSEDD
ncbi:hypothetical protein Kpol_1036p77 [Vanderwaltozyma polyspora DSM 70294]|uniref:Uncharacterized protein n=1 Tax=Vanderwaltozyma polyspora (strain ATCC 22028 / DSM 70294 / BCRC 21397 / CBS 2163 / NBRC 10782 / NRRL Y-8283 / UCD 57-17) TaxID=436907 RepID=A7TEM4_VANPO|nr:uncharacterized protein Kpol_1036p77 [Vanderwaltozyma polyspora DSM 70294]EDO19331.1 hypothetical protein Kpol_1036p77 [Vanderwaltozyma polyspora DSM 70294]